MGVYMKRFLLAVICLLCLVGLAFAQSGTKKKKPKPFDYGKVVINNFSSKVGLAPVEFDHWSHRARFTCRLCHVDIGFAMKGGDTQIKAADNMRGYFCGVCHNDKMIVEDRKVFSACAKEFSRGDLKRCERCHVANPNSKKEAEFYKLADRLPKERGGNGINWELAEEKGQIKLIDYIEGVSVKRLQLPGQKDFSIGSKMEGMPDIIFSHKKHTVWNGCEVCHPEIFVGVKKGATKYTMIELFEGKYCGVCHDTVAFPQTDCQRCHTRPLQ
jgi:c(7)-type cytochrome triheme protein